MKILTLEDRSYALEKIPEWVDEKLRFAVLDNSDPENPDFFYIPLIFLESFNMLKVIKFLFVIKSQEVCIL